MKYFWVFPKLIESKSIIFFRLNTYSAHSRPPCIHSYINPTVRRAKIVVDHKNIFVGVIWAAHGVGKSRAISRSNRRKRMATRKNRIEKGRRAEPSGSNPHSYGESFSASGKLMGSQNPTIIKMVDRVIVMIIISRIEFIVFS